MDYNGIIYERIKNLEKSKRSKWGRGVCHYAYMIIDKANEEPKQLLTLNNVEDIAKCGASSLKEASWGGVYLCYNYDIAFTLATPSEIKRTRGGWRRPNRNEEWLDVQTRALSQACELIKDIIKGGVYAK